MDVIIARYVFLNLYMEMKEMISVLENCALLLDHFCSGNFSLYTLHFSAWKEWDLG